MKLIYVLLLLTLAVPTMAETDKAMVLKTLGPYSYEVDYFAAKKFKHVQFLPSNVERAQIDQMYLNVYQRYLAYGIKSQIEPSRSIASAAQEVKPLSLKFKVPQVLGLVAFKRGELKAACPRAVESAKAWGIKTIAYYHPVHYSGGNSDSYKLPKSPVYGKHWQYEVTYNFSNTEFEDCMDLISESGLRMHYIPHLESIATLVGKDGSGEWRLLSGVPIDDNYFHHAFGPLLSYLHKRSTSFRVKGSLDITIAAEIDPMVFSYAQKTREGMSWLKEKLNEVKMRNVKYYLNTNGDFYHGHELLKEREIDCGELVELIKEIDGLTPSMYGDRGHLKKDARGKLSIDETVGQFKKNMSDYLSGFCQTKSKEVRAEILKKDVGLGEFAVNKDDKQTYTDILKDAESKILFVQFWNHGSWDHHGVLTAGDTELKDQLFQQIKAHKP